MRTVTVRLWSAALLAALSVVATVALQGASTPLARTPDGRPDFQGVWNNATQTPLQRPAALGAKQFYSEEELRRLRLRDHDSDAVASGDPGTYNQFWWEEGGFLKQTSLIVDPPDGRIPALTPEGERRRRELRARNLDGSDTRKNGTWPSAASAAARRNCRAVTTTISRSCKRPATSPSCRR